MTIIKNLWPIISVNFIAYILFWIINQEANPWLWDAQTKVIYGLSVICASVLIDLAINIKSERISLYDD